VALFYERGNIWLIHHQTLGLPRDFRHGVRDFEPLERLLFRLYFSLQLQFFKLVEDFLNFFPWFHF